MARRKHRDTNRQSGILNASPRVSTFGWFFLISTLHCHYCVHTYSERSKQERMATLSRPSQLRCAVPTSHHSELSLPCFASRTQQSEASHSYPTLPFLALPCTPCTHHPGMPSSVASLTFLLSHCPLHAWWPARPVGIRF